MRKKILLIDNHDSFTYNLAELLRNNGKISFNIVTAELLTKVSVPEFDGIIFSPGPGLPEEHPVMFNILEHYVQTKSILGICLGLQAIAIHFGGQLFNFEKVVHGQVKKIRIIKPEPKLFNGFPAEFEAGLYHSWAMSKDNFPDCLDVVAISSDDIIMAISHNTLDVCGVQFHPESIMTPLGQKLINNWIAH
jgi:anthranilate synthase/aminodeoxychorismate synthase-like glutamine amidotransferase